MKIHLKPNNFEIELSKKLVNPVHTLYMSFQSVELISDFDFKVLDHDDICV